METYIRRYVLAFSIFVGPVVIVQASSLMRNLFGNQGTLGGFPAAGVMDTPRIFGGMESEPGQFPYIISLHGKRFNNKTKESTMAHECGGAIVDETTVVTAGHCVWNKVEEDLLVVAGAHNIKIKESSQQRMKVSEILLHPKYNAKDQAGPYDIAILRLEKALKFNDRVKKVDALAKKNQPAEGQCYNAGWGNQFPVTSMHYQGSETLTTGKTTIIGSEDCKTSYQMDKEKLKTAICARSQMGHGTCQGDSGGPLVCPLESSDELYLAGLVSFGFKVCNNGFHPDVYTDMGHPAIYNFVDLFLRTGEVNATSLDEEKKISITSSRSAAENPVVKGFAASAFG